MDQLTLIIPAKNEKDSLPKVLGELKPFNLKIIVLLEKNDVETIESIKNYNCEIAFQDGKGFGNALILGASKVQTEFFCIFNADGSFNPNELKNMLQTINLKNSDFIFATRYEKNCASDDDTIITYIGNFIFTKIGNIFFNVNITDILYTFVLGRTEKIKSLNLKQNDFSLCVELPIKAKRAGFKLNTSPAHERKRIAGKKKVNAFRDGFKILLYMIKIFFK